jgi:hypothetical protein
MTTTGIIVALAIGSIALFSTIFVVALVMIRNRWQQLGETPPENPRDQSDS